MSLIDEVKSGAEILRKADKIPEYQAILELREKLVDLQEENANLKSELRALKENDAFEKSLVYEKNAYYVLKKDGANEGPYCPVCWGSDAKKIRMTDTGRSYYCNKCRAHADH